MDKINVVDGIYLGLGTNLGSKNKNLENALIEIEKEIGVIEKKSSIHKTKAWGKTDQPDYLNMVIKVKTILNPQELLSKCLEIETILGRIRKEKWGARIIDIDILYYNDIHINDSKLIIPHPHIMERDFVLKPLRELI